MHNIDKMINKALNVEKKIFVKQTNDYLSIFLRKDGKVFRYGKPVKISNFPTKQDVNNYIKNEIAHILLLDKRTSEPISKKKKIYQFDNNDYVNIIKSRRKPKYPYQWRGYLDYKKELHNKVKGLRTIEKIYQQVKNNQVKNF